MWELWHQKNSTKIVEIQTTKVIFLLYNYCVNTKRSRGKGRLSFPIRVKLQACTFDAVTEKKDSLNRASIIKWPPFIFSVVFTIWKGSFSMEEIIKSKLKHSRYQDFRAKLFHLICSKTASSVLNNFPV